MAQSRLSDSGYKNWITVGLGIQVTRDGLENIVQKAVDNYHNWLLRNLPRSIETWKSWLEQDHRSTDKTTICWDNSDESKWFNRGAAWEIAKIFMAPLGRRKHLIVNAKTTDIGGLLNVLGWSPILDPGCVNVNKIKDARDARNMWSHAPQLRISDGDKANAFASFISLLQDPTLCYRKDVQDAIKKLKTFGNIEVTVLAEKEVEEIVQLGRDLALDAVSLESKITLWSDQVGANSADIQTLKESLDNFIKTNKLQKEVESMKKRIDEFENQMSQQFQSLTIRVEKLEENSTSEPGQSVCDGKSPIKFNPVCDRMKEEFVGREWLFDDIDDWLKKDLGPRDSRAFSITGGPGTGKNSIARELVRRNKQRKRLAGYHFFQKDNPRTCDLECLVYNFSSQLSKNLPEYAALIGSYLKDANKFQDYPEKLFDHLITTPLQELHENTKYFLFIGSLDEGGRLIASCFARLSAAIPPWLRIIFTARKNATPLCNLFPDCVCANLDFTTKPQPKTSSPRDRDLEEDMRTFVTTKYKKLQLEYEGYIPPFFENNQKAAIRKIVTASECCFLYAKLILEHIFQGHDIRALPSTLSEIYCLDFRRRFPNEKSFEKKVAPVLEVVLAIERVNIKITRGMSSRNSKLSVDAIETSGTLVKEVVEMHLLSGITMRDLHDVFKLFSDYLFQDSGDMLNFSHASVKKWLREEKSDFYCDVIEGHSIMVKFYLQMLKTHPSHPENLMKSLVGCLSHSSFLPESRRIKVNFLISKFRIEATVLLYAALSNTFLEDFAMKLLDDTDVLDQLRLDEKAQYLYLAIARNCKKVATKLIDTGVIEDVCVPRFSETTEPFDQRRSWNENVQEYFRKLKSREKNVISLECLKEKPFYLEDWIDDYTLKIIQKPISEVERLVKEGECNVCFTHGRHVFSLGRFVASPVLETFKLLLEYGANINERGNLLGETALMKACKMEYDDLVSFLLDKGADVNQRDINESTALHHALERKENTKVKPYSNRKVRIIEMLLEHKADPHIKNSRGVSAIDIAKQEGGITLEELTRRRRRRDGSETEQDTSI